MSNRICAIDIDERGLARPTPEIEQERKVAIFDLLEENSFGLPTREDRPTPQGPYRLGLAIREGRLVFDIATEDTQKVGEFHLSLGPFRQVVKDYFQICESYFEAVKRLPPEPDRGDRHGPARHPQRGAHGCCRNGSTARPRSISTPPGVSSP